MLRSHKGTSTLEWVVVTIIVVGIVGLAIYDLAQAIGLKLTTINVEIGG